MTSHLVSVSARNQPGVLARVSRVFAQRGINFPAFIADDSGLHFVTKDRAATVAALGEAGLAYSTTEVAEVVLEDRPGSLAELCEELARAEIDIEVAFGVVNQGGGRIYIHVDDVKRAAPILNSMTGRGIAIGAGLGRIPLTA